MLRPRGKKQDIAGMLHNLFSMAYMAKKRGQVALLTGLVAGIAGLIILVVIYFVYIQTIVNANLLSASSSITVTNESDDSGTLVWLNSTNYTLQNYNSTNDGFSITAVWTRENVTGYGYNISLPAGYYTFYAAVGKISAANATTFNNTSISYTYNRQSTEEASLDRLRGNYSEGIDNISGKIPTILLIGAVVILIGALFILVEIARRRQSGSGTRL